MRSRRPDLRIRQFTDAEDGAPTVWASIALIIRRPDLPVFLAGGLDPTNVQDAITEVCPFGVDLCSGVRTNGALEPAKLATLITAVHRADESRGP